VKVQAIFFYHLIVMTSIFVGLEARAERIRFEDLPRLVREKNENVAASREQVRAHSERTGRLARSFLPQIAAQFGQEELRAGSGATDQKAYWRIDSTVNLYRGGRDGLEDQIRSSQRDLAITISAAEFHTELLEAKRTFWKSIAISKKIAERKESVDRNEVNIRSARRRAGAGIATTADAAQFEIHKITLQRDLRRLELEQDRLLNRLSVALAVNEHENIEIVGDFPVIANDQIKPLLTNEQLDVVAHRELSEIDGLRAKQIGRWLQPKVDLYVSYGLPSLSEDYTRALRGDREWAAGVRVIFDLGQGIEDRKEAVARNAAADATRLRGAHKQREIVANDHEIRHDLKVLSELIMASDEDVRRAESFLRLTELEYARGVKNGPDLLEAFQKYFEFRDRRIEYYSDYFEARSSLEGLIASRVD